MEKTVQDFMGLKHIAIVGASRSGKKFGNTIAAELKERQYQVYLVHPEAKEIGGEPCYPSLAALEGKAEGVLICVPPRAAVQALREAAQTGLKNIWLQQGAQSSEALALAKELGLNPVTGKCILMYAQPVRSVHAFHRLVARLFGQM